MEMQIAGLLKRHARYRPDHLAVVFEEHRLSYSAFNARVNRLANALVALEIAKGDKIATVLPNCLEQLEVYWAVAKIGAVVVPLSPLLREQGLATLLNDSDTSLVITTSSFIPILDAVKAALPTIAADRYLLVDGMEVDGYRSYHALTAAASEQEPPSRVIGDDDLYNIIYSSGTTGLPKGIMHTHYVRAMYAYIFATNYRMTPESVVLYCGSLVFNPAFITMLMVFLMGGVYIVHRQFDPQRLIETVATERVTHILLVPSQVLALLNAPTFSNEALHSLEMICSCGAPLHGEHKARLIQLLPDRFHELYGLTEGFVTILDKKDYTRKGNSVGVPPPSFSMRIVDELGNDLPQGEVGEIIGRAPIQMTGYYNRPDLTADAIVDGWLHTGDMGYVDEDGFLYLVDRKKDMIISGGINVYPRDIEEVIVQHPDVREVAVFGVPDEKWGERPLACVILQANATSDELELRHWINNHLDARYQQVSKVVILDDFPRGVSGKTLKRVLRAPYWEQRPTKI